MVKEHPDLTKCDDSAIIWKYMPLSQFLYFIKESKLYFRRVDKFPSDRNDGVLTIEDKKAFGNNGNKQWDEYWEKDRKRYYVSCWIKSDYELALMWQSYGKEGVVIKTTVGHIKEALKDDNHTIYLSDVTYGDASFKEGERLNAMKPVFTKRKFFSQEQEVRLLYSDSSELNTDRPIGHEINVDIKKLIMEVRTYPNSEEYFIKLIQNAISENGLDIKVQKSDI